MQRWKSTTNTALDHIRHKQKKSLLFSIAPRECCLVCCLAKQARRRKTKAWTELFPGWTREIKEVFWLDFNKKHNLQASQWCMLVNSRQFLLHTSSSGISADCRSRLERLSQAQQMPFKRKWEIHIVSVVTESAANNNTWLKLYRYTKICYPMSW